MNLKTHGLVLAETPYSSQGKILTLLTPEGMIEALLKVTPSKRSRLAAATEVLSYSEFCLFAGRTRYFIDTAELEENFFSLREDLVKISLAAYLCELTRFVIPQPETAGETLSLLLNTLFLLNKGKRTPTLLKAIYELRLMCISGFQPDTDCCAGCGREDGSLTFLPIQGIILCPECLSQFPPDPDSRKNIRIPFPQPVFFSFKHIISAPKEKLFSFKISSEAEKVLGETVERFTLCQTGAHFKSLELYKTMTEV